MSCNYLDDMEDIDAMIYEKNHVNVVLPRTIGIFREIRMVYKIHDRLP